MLGLKYRKVNQKLLDDEKRLLELGVLGFSLLQNGDVGVGGTRQREVLWQLQFECVDLLVAYIPHHQRRIVRG